MTLFAVVGILELQRAYRSGLKAFSARSEDSPELAVYTSLEDARRLSRERVLGDRSSCAFVISFQVKQDFPARFESRSAGANDGFQFPVKEGRLAEFNSKIVGALSVVDAYFGKEFRGLVASQFGLKDKDAIEQFIALCNSFPQSVVDIRPEIILNHEIVFLHSMFWSRLDVTSQNNGRATQNEVLSYIRGVWCEVFEDLPLPCQ